MGKHISFQVKESPSHLRDLIRREHHPKNVLRLQSLLHIKEKTFTKQVELAQHLGYGVRSMELWLKDYKEGGLESMLLKPKGKQKRKRKVSAEVHQGLCERLHDAESGFHSYVQALDWVNTTYGVDYKYTTLREYMIEFFGTRIKRPRKSHIKKTEQATTDFLKLT